MSVIGYRPDIDGLRAVAVLAVILFHAGMPGVTGGFVGVDVFFVISGFLITSIILKDLNAGTFSFGAFWERRARRILPALCTVILATLTAGWFLLLPDDYAALGAEAASQTVFASNILFYKQAGYFDQASILKPLLHTWSLSVEEQYYLLFPVAAFSIWKYMRHKMFAFLAAAAIVSFALCILVMRHNPELAFFMLPFRGWELLTGAILACHLQNPVSADRGVREGVALGGLAAILGGIFFYNEATIFPGWAAIMPCFGAAAIIWANASGQTWTGRVLSFRPVVFIGLISYSWYLWHWPAIVFAKYTPLLTFDNTIMWMCIGGSFIAAVLTWYFIETPFRKFRLLAARKRLFISSAVVLSSFALLGGIILFSGGAPLRLDPAIVALASGINDQNPHRKACDKIRPEDINADKVCQTNQSAGPPSFIVWGDSHADAIAPLFFELSQRYGRNGYVLTHHGCESVAGVRKTTWSAGFTCYEFNKSVMDLIRRHDIKNVFLVSQYNSWMLQNVLDPSEVIVDGAYPEGYKTMLGAGLANTLDTLKKDGRNIYFFLEVPTSPFDPPRILAMDRMKDPNVKPRDGLPRKGYIMSREAQITPFLNRYGRKNITVIDPLEILCPSVMCKVADNDHSLYYNYGHLSAHGALFLAPLFEPYFKTP